MPTILDRLRVDAPSRAGPSLLPLRAANVWTSRPLSETWYPRHHYGWSELTAIRDGRYQFIAAPRRELYDPQTDPDETHNLAESNPARADAQDRALQDFVARTSAHRAAAAPRPVDPAVEERLRALGYVGAASARGRSRIDRAATRRTRSRSTT